MRLSSVVVVSPHLDDAALSCGAAIRRLANAGRDVAVVTVFTGDVASDAALSPLAKKAHLTWHLPSQPFAQRRREDECAMRALGARATHLGLLDAVYRTGPSGRPLYDGFLAGEVDPWDEQELLPMLRERLAEALRPIRPAAVFCPLGVGGHADHLLTRRAVESLAGAHRLVHYVEYPYAARREVAVPEPDSGAEYVLQPTRAEAEARIDAVCCYESQLLGLFPSPWQRARIVLGMRLPAIGRYVVPRPDARASRARAAARMGRDASALGGEVYRSAADEPSAIEGLFTDLAVSG